MCFWQRALFPKGLKGGQRGWRGGRPVIRTRLAHGELGGP